MLALTTAPPVLIAERIKLQMLPASDAARALRYVVENRRHLERWDPPRPDGFYTEQYWTRRLAENLREYYEERGARFWAVEAETGNVIGTVSFNNLVRSAFQACYLGYGIDHRYEGRGYMQEALRAAIAFAFGELRLHRIMANYVPENARSARLLARLGFEIEGRAREYLFIAGCWRDHVLSSLINPVTLVPANENRVVK